MAYGMVMIARINIATGHLLGLFNDTSEQAEAGVPPVHIVWLLVLASCSATAQLLLRRHNGSLASLLLRLDRHAPYMLLILAAVSATLASSILLATFLFSFLVMLIEAGLIQNTRLAIL
jgi:hypothetical protein